MGLDYQELRAQVKKLGERAAVREKRLQVLRKTARDLLKRYARRQNELRELVDQAAADQPDLRCARPLEEGIDAGFSAPSCPENLRLLAVDGSQINPDYHAPVPFYLINVAGISVQLDQDQPPSVFLESQLRDEGDADASRDMISAGRVAQERDIAEREFLATWSSEITPDGSGVPLVTLTDGPLELWESLHGAGGRSTGRSPGFNRYLEALERLHELSATTAGYVDRPRADLVVSALELTQLSDQQLARGRPEGHFLGVSDADLYLKLLQPGQRSAVFAIQSPSSSKYRGVSALHFFYLNVGRKDRSHVARVEIPAWVAEDRSKLDILHAALLQQCRVMGGKAYPYLLHRAHEIAVVTRDDRDLLTELLIKERARHGLGWSEVSNKQYYKDLPGRKRYS